MSLNAAAIAIMVERGLSAADILAVAEALETKRDRTGAERQARYRDRHKVTRDVTRDAPPNDIDILTPPDISPKPNGLCPQPKKHRLPANWEPQPFGPTAIAAQTIARWEPGRMERELAKFKDHHTAAGTKWENWQAAWGKWVNNSTDFERGHHGTGSKNIAAATAAFGHPSTWSDDQPF